MVILQQLLDTLTCEQRKPKSAKKISVSSNSYLKPPPPKSIGNNTLKFSDCNLCTGRVSNQVTKFLLSEQYLH